MTEKNTKSIITEYATKEKLLLNSLIAYFTKHEHKNVLISIVNETSTISLRILDWFVTNYSKEHSSMIMKSAILKDVNIYNAYKSQLKAFNKKLFDPFCRQHNDRNKFRFFYDEHNFIYTTIGQLNFFRWAIENHVIQYVLDHYDEIKRDLKNKQKKQTSSMSIHTSSSSSDSLSSVLYDTTMTNLSTSNHNTQTTSPNNNTKTVNYIVCFN